ncbi:hypothetical protein E5987_04115 [Parasutterella sp. NM82_D38]|uniref:Uncharacterized protein n=1 Tax=Parasutterella muris TaxID=2565572 RepID=A0A6L6YHY1_9BURK|nr:hypothetical protein [Parasutterella muris]
MMHFYGIGYKELLSLPIRFFWTLVSNIERIQASFDVRSLSIQHVAVATGMAGGEGVKQLRDSLVLQIGEVQKVKIDPMSERLNRNQIDDLKRTIRRQNKNNKK